MHIYYMKAPRRKNKPEGRLRIHIYIYYIICTVKVEGEKKFDFHSARTAPHAILVRIYTIICI